MTDQEKLEMRKQLAVEFYSILLKRKKKAVPQALAQEAIRHADVLIAVLDEVP